MSWRRSGYWPMDLPSMTTPSTSRRRPYYLLSGAEEGLSGAEERPWAGRGALIGSAARRSGDGRRSGLRREIPVRVRNVPLVGPGHAAVDVPRDRVRWNRRVG